MRLTRIFGIAWLGLAAIATAASAQTFRGIVRLSDGQTPAPNARIWLATPRGLAVDTTRSNERGEFSLTAPSPGRYRLVIRRLGYTPEHTDPFELETGQVHEEDVVLLSTRILPTVDVAVGRETRRWFGIDPRGLGSRFMRPEEIDRMRPMTNDVGDLLRHASLAGVNVQSVGAGEQCVQTRLMLGCADIYIDGMLYGHLLPPMPSSDVETMVVLRPLDSVMVGGNGAVMIFTGR